MRDRLVPLARAAGFASACGIAVMTILYAFQTLAQDVRAANPSARVVPHAMPQPELTGWLAAALAAIALATRPLPRAGPWWAWGLARAAAGTLAVALPVDAVARGASVELAPWAYALFWGPLFVALLLTAVPTRAPRERPKEPDDAGAPS